jgi:hypothetical protein
MQEKVAVSVQSIQTYWANHIPSSNSYGNGAKYHNPSKPIGQQACIAHKLFDLFN